VEPSEEDVKKYLCKCQCLIDLALGNPPGIDVDQSMIDELRQEGFLSPGGITRDGLIAAKVLAQVFGWAREVSKLAQKEEQNVQVDSDSIVVRAR
jgi:hypothetical protein